jgi:GTP:adenosylcobinamide-phosphate guanylyltransferase
MTGHLAILLAGSRPSGDPLALAAGVATKALVPIAGRPMLDHVARTLVDHPGLSGVLVLAQQPEALTADPGCAWMAHDPRIRFAASGAGISRTLLDLLDQPGVPLPWLVTTADNVLLSAAMIDDFLRGAADADVAVAMVSRDVLLPAYPQSRRTWLKFRDGWWSGANMFRIGSDRVRGLLLLWGKVEQDRKKGWRVIAAFGPLLMIAAALRLLTIAGGVARVGRRFGLTARMVAMRQPEACIDADKPEDVVLIEAILARMAAKV